MKKVFEFILDGEEGILNVFVPLREILTSTQGSLFAYFYFFIHNNK